MAAPPPPPPAEGDRPFRLFYDEVCYPYPEMRWEPDPQAGPRVRTTPLGGSHHRQVNCLGFNASGAQLASGSDDETARVWDVATARPVLKLEGHGKGVAQLCWEPRSERVVATLCMDKTLRFFDARSGPRAVASVKASQEYINVAWHHDAVTLAIGSSVGGASGTAASAAAGESSALDSGSSSAAAIKDCVTLVDARKAAASRRLRFTYEVNEFCWAPYDRGAGDAPGRFLMLTTELSTVEILNVDAPPKGPGATTTTPAPSSSTTTPTPTPTPVAATSSSTTSGGPPPPPPPPKPSSAPETYTMRAHTGDCYCIAQKDNFLAVGSKDSLVSIWDLEWCACLRCVSRHVTPVRTVAFSSGARLLASAAYDPGIDIADVETTTKVHHVDHQYSMNALAWHPHEDVLAYAIDTKVNSLGVSSFAAKAPTAREGSEDAPYIALVHAPTLESKDMDDDDDDDGGDKPAADATKKRPRAGEEGEEDPDVRHRGGPADKH